MAKSKSKAKPAREKKPVDPERLMRIRAVLKQIALVMIFIAVCGGTLYAVYGHVDRKLTFPAAPPRVVLKDRPTWMSDFLAEQIIETAQPAGTHSTFSHQMLVDAEKMLRSNPWIRKVNQLRRVYGNAPGDTIEIDCEYRTPIALIHWGDYYWLIDDEAVKLPEQYTAQQVPRIVVGRDRRINIRIIEGIQQPPPESGQRWIGEDLAAGLEMARLLFGRPYTEEIVKIDVSNFEGRQEDREAHVVLITQYGSKIRWGRPPSARDFFVEVPAVKKLEYLQGLHREKKRVDAGYSWIDVRTDGIRYPLHDAKADGND